MRRAAWVSGTALPELRRLVEANENDSAFTLAMEIKKIAPDDSTLLALTPRFSRRRVLITDVEGVRVSRASFADTSKWLVLGTTPIDTIEVPFRSGLFKFEKKGYRTVYRVLHPFFRRPTLMVANDDSLPEMLRVAGRRIGRDAVSS